MPKDSDKYLLESALKVYAVIEDLVEGGIVVNKDAKVIWISKDYLAFLGRSTDTDILGHEIERMLPQSRMRQVVETGKAHPVDIMQYGERFLPVTRLPIRDDKGHVIGAFAFAFKDFMTHLQPLTDRIAKLQKRLNRVEESLAVQRDAKFTFENLIGASQAMVNVHRMARRAAQTDATVLLLGETGTGKELVAHAIHSASPRFGKPFISLNVAAIPDTLLEAEFFGVEPGAYTGANRQPRPGKFLLANKGTLFLDEIGDMPLSLQSKLLRVLQEQEVEPLGSNKLVKVDVRIVAATSRDLLAMVQDGSFRSDLYYRINVLPIRIPPLRERLDDIELLAQALIDRIGAIGENVPFSLQAGALDVLKKYDWPGNVRELENVLRQACIRAESPELTAQDFIDILQPDFLSIRPAATPSSASLTNRVEQTERDAVLEALRQSKGNKAAAARMLGITRPSLYAKMAKYRIGQESKND